MSIEFHTRRSFIKGVSATTLGVTFAFVLPGCRPTGEVSDRPNDTALLSWLTLHPDNSATIEIPQTDLGQSVSTTIPQIVADELELDWSSVSYSFYDPRKNAAHDNVFGWTATLGSLSAHYLYDPARTAAAQIRYMLLSAAATTLGVPLDTLSAEASHIMHVETGRSLAFAELAQLAVDVAPPDITQVKLKDPSQRKIVGLPVAQLGIEDIVRGKRVFGIDIDLPGMRYAAVRQSPVYGARIVSIEDDAIRRLSGNPAVHRISGDHVGYNSPVPEGEDPELWAAAVNVDDCVAVVADSWWEAKVALDSLSIQWSGSEHETFSSTGLAEMLKEKVQNAMATVAEVGNVDAALKSSAQSASAVYSYPFMEPAPMEPMNCSALVDENEVHVWTNSQYADDAWRLAHEICDVPPEQAHIHLMHAGGGFGRRLQNDFVYLAVHLAKQNAGTPIKMLFTREESTKHSYYAPLTVTKFDGALDSEGAVSAWRCRVASGYSAEQSYGAARFPFNVPNIRIEYERTQSTPVPFGWMRGVGFTQHLWMNYSFLDELRVKSGKQTIDFYKDLLDPGRIPVDADNYELAMDRARRHIRLLEHAASAGPWRSPKPEGIGRGIAVSDSDYTAGYGSSTKVAIVDVTLDKDGVPKIERVYIAIDAGTVINPDVVHAQLEGGVAYALTTAFMSEITVENGQVEQSNFHDYPMLKLHEMPKVDIDILPSEGTPTGVGEDSVPITIAALVNAIADAGGPRVRRLPINLADASDAA